MFSFLLLEDSALPAASVGLGGVKRDAPQHHSVSAQLL